MKLNNYSIKYINKFKENISIRLFRYILTSDYDNLLIKYFTNMKIGMKIYLVRYGSNLVLTSVVIVLSKSNQFN